jgi:hypothetical protein
VLQTVRIQVLVADGGAAAFRNLGTTWEPLRPNTGENGRVAPTRKQDESVLDILRAAGRLDACDASKMHFGSWPGRRR